MNLSIYALMGIDYRIREIENELSLLKEIKQDMIKKGQPKEAKKHWTQTPNGKKKMALIQKKVWAAKKAKLKE